MMRIRVVLILLIFFYGIGLSWGQVPTVKRLSERRKEERERILIEQAKKVVANPKYKRLYHPYDRIEIVERKAVKPNPKSQYDCYPIDPGDMYYVVFFYDSKTPQFEWGTFAMAVMILDENGAVVQFAHGNGESAFICGEPLYKATPKATYGSYAGSGGKRSRR